MRRLDRHVPSGRPAPPGQVVTGAGHPGVAPPHPAHPPLNEPPSPLVLHLVRRRPAAWRLQAKRVRPRHPALHGAAPAGLRAGSHQVRRAGRVRGEDQGRPEPRAFPPPQGRPELLQHQPAGPGQAAGRPGPHPSEPLRLHPRLLACGPRHLRALRFPHANRATGQGRPAVPRDREVRQSRSAPKPGGQRRHGRGVRGTDPQVRRDQQRNGR